MTVQKTIAELQKGDVFFFSKNKSKLFTVLQKRVNERGKVINIKTSVTGRLHPVYLGTNHKVEQIVQ